MICSETIPWPAMSKRPPLVSTPLLKLSPAGLFCPQGEFFIDPHQPVDRAIITHSHADHARKGSRRYLTASSGRGILAARLGPRASIETLEYGETLSLNGVTVSLHPAGHILGSAQVRIEYKGEVWVVSGDYKVVPDTTCRPFEPVRCHTFITEATFGKPTFVWPDPQQVFTEIHDWWRANQKLGRASILYAYALGKAQRIHAGLDRRLGPIYLHPDVEQLTLEYRLAGVEFPRSTSTRFAVPPFSWSESILIAPPSAHGSAWARQFGPANVAFVSGWGLIPGTVERRGFPRGFVLSDHADWNELLFAVTATGAERVYVTHGDEEPLVRELTQRGLTASPLLQLNSGLHQPSLFSAGR